MSYRHSMKDHITPEVIERLKDKSEEAKDAHTRKIISHIDEVTSEDGSFSDYISDYEKLYAAGIGHYYLGHYEKCMEAEEKAYPHFNDEMGIAAIFWHTLAAWRCGREETLFKEHYNIRMDVGHHKSYDLIMALAGGFVSPESVKLMTEVEHNPLELSIMGYGFYRWLVRRIEKGDRSLEKTASDVLERVYADDGFWITYAYLGARNDKLCGGIFPL